MWPSSTARGGLVEAITFRTIVLRDLAGVDKEDTDRVVELMRTVAEELRRDPSYAATILEPIEIFGVDDFAESQVTIKARLKTRPLEQWNVGREYRRRLKKAFDAAGIEIPFPYRSLYVGEASRPLEVLLRASGASGGNMSVDTGHGARAITKRKGL